MSTYLFVFSDGSSHLRTCADDADARRVAVETPWGTSTVRAIWPVAGTQRDRLHVPATEPAVKVPPVPTRAQLAAILRAVALRLTTGPGRIAGTHEYRLGLVGADQWLSQLADATEARHPAAAWLTETLRDAVATALAGPVPSAEPAPSGRPRRTGGCSLAADGLHDFEENDEDGPDYDTCRRCRMWRHETETA